MARIAARVRAFRGADGDKARLTGINFLKADING